MLDIALSSISFSVSLVLKRRFSAGRFSAGPNWSVPAASGAARRKQRMSESMFPRSACIRHAMKPGLPPGTGDVRSRENVGKTVR
ncbi:hypothetical protein [Burkholderia sp. MSMB1078WGS]|uniref:hypothetical protein n=1 Tax=Burkholderia sp. MSMB1078WGS TaxID=1637900 RepID=UPI000AF6595D|nr:hypothetical protein [Burkholderia sp. MSMB1078WGS]